MSARPNLGPVDADWAKFWAAKGVAWEFYWVGDDILSPVDIATDEVIDFNPYDRLTDEERREEARLRAAIRKRLKKQRSEERRDAARSRDAAPAAPRFAAV